MVRRLLGVALALSALALAAVCAVTAAEVRRTSDAVREADHRFEVRRGAGTAWNRSDALRPRLARELLGANDDLDFRHAASLFRSSQSTDVVVRGNPGELRAESTIALERFDKGDRDRLRRARTASMLGVMAYQDAQSNQETAASLLKRSGELFRRAIALDPSDAAAKFNLELILQLEATHGGAFAIRTGGSARGSGSISGAKSSGRGY
jgi:hypothetical protein